MVDFLPELSRDAVISYAAGDLRSDKLPARVEERLEHLNAQMSARSHRWNKGLLATALALTEHA